MYILIMLLDTSYRIIRGKERLILPMFDKTFSRRMVKTNTDYLGLTPQDSEVGELVVLIRGCATPFILRRSGEGDDYLLVGECYIHGLMDNNAIDMGEPSSMWIIQSVLS